MSHVCVCARACVHVHWYVCAGDTKDGLVLGVGHSMGAAGLTYTHLQHTCLDVSVYMCVRVCVPVSVRVCVRVCVDISCMLYEIT